MKGAWQTLVPSPSLTLLGVTLSSKALQRAVSGGLGAAGQPQSSSTTQPAGGRSNERRSEWRRVLLCADEWGPRAEEVSIYTVPTVPGSDPISASPIEQQAKEVTPTSVSFISKDRQGLEVASALTLLMLTPNAVPHLPCLQGLPFAAIWWPEGPAALGFSQAQEQAPWMTFPTPKVALASASGGHALHCSRPPIDGYPLANTRTKNNARLSPLAEMIQLQLETGLSEERGSGLLKVAQLPGSQDSTQFRFTTMFRVSGHFQIRTKVSPVLGKVGNKLSGLLADPEK